MSKDIKRGYSINDEREFGDKSIQKIYDAAKDLHYLLDRGYKIKGASIFVGNHYLLSERQRLAIVRTVSSSEDIRIRKTKEAINLENKVVNIDGFNTIITLEVALSGSILLKCMDGTIRDLAGMGGSYRLIEKTKDSIIMIGKILEQNKIRKAIFYLDSPVSNSGRLKEQIFELLSEFNFEVQVENINNVDAVLSTMENVITSDAIILDKCISWINLNEKIIESNIEQKYCIDFSFIEK